MSRARVYALAVLIVYPVGAAACGDDDDGGGDAAQRADAAMVIDASGARDGAVPDGGAAAPAIVVLTPETLTAPRGATITVAWSSTGATACTVSVGDVAVATGLAGELEVTVDGVVEVAAQCEPAGVAALARA